MKEDVDYSVSGKHVAWFTLLRGLHKGATYRYLVIKVGEMDAETATINFTYEVVKGSEFEDADDLKNNPDFEETISQILHQVLIEAADTKIEENIDNRKDDSEKPDKKRRLRKKGSAVPKG